MKRQILALLLAVAMIVVTFAACGKKDVTNNPKDTSGTVDNNNDDSGNSGDDQPSDDCEHTFSSEWASDATSHWHAATCPHGQVKDSLAEHSDANEDGKCDVCAYEIGHEHTFSEAWSSNETKHWHAATCSHTSEMSEIALHKDDDKNAECDVCQAHVHITDDAGYCTSCGKQVVVIDEADLASVLKAILICNTKVQSGSLTYDRVIRSATEESTYGYTQDYVFSTDGIYFKTTEDTTVTELWIKQTGAEEATAITVVTENGTVVDAEPIDGELARLAGPTFSVSTLAGEYGAEVVLNVLYELSQEASASDYTVTHDADNNTYTFSFNSLIVNADVAEDVPAVNYFETTVTFGYSDGYVLTSLNIVCDAYTNSLANEADHDYTYDAATNTITMKDTATADTYTYTVTQTAGNRAAIDMEAADEYKPESITVYEDEALANKAEEIEVDIRYIEGGFDLYLGCAPDGTFVKFVKDQISVTVTDAEGNATQAVGAYLVGDVIQVLVYGMGDYVITFTYGETSQEIALTVTGEVVTPSDTYITLNGTDTYTWEGPFEFTAPESGSYTFALPDGVLAAWDADLYDNEPWSSTPFVDKNDPYYNGDGTFTVEIAKDQVFAFYFMVAVKNTDYTVNYTFVAHDVEVGGGEEDDNTTPLSTDSTNQINAQDVVYSFTAPSDGTMTLTVGNAVMGAVTMSYTINGGDAVAMELGTTVTVILRAGENLLINVQAAGYSSLGATWTGDSSSEPIQPEPEPEEKFLEIGENIIPVTDEDLTNQVIEYTFVADEAGTYSFASNDLAAQIYANDMFVAYGSSYLEAGEYTIMVITAYLSETGAYTLTVEYTAPATGDGEGSGTEEDPYVIESLPTNVSANASANAYTFYTFTGVEDGILTITYPNENSWWYVSDPDDYYASGYQTATQTAEIKAGVTYTIALGVWEAEDADLEVSLTFVAQALPNDGDFEKPLNISTYAENSFDYAGEGYAWFQYNSWIDGTLTLTFTGNVNVKYGADAEALTEVTNQTVVVIDIAAGSSYYVAVQTADLAAGAISFSAQTAYKPGTANNPLALDPFVGDHTADYTGTDIWYAITATEGGYVTLSSTATGIKLGGGNSTYSISYNTEEGESIRFYANAGAPTYVVVGNWASTDAAEIPFSMTFEAGEHEPDGTYEYPFVIDTVPGDYTCNFDGGWNYIWYKVTTTATGTITVTSTDATAGLVVASTASAYASDAKTGNGSVAYGANAGTYYIGVMGDAAGEIPFSVSFEEGELQADGTATLPYTVVLGENTCTFPGGYDSVWYVITVETEGTLTISSTYANAWLDFTPVAGDTWADGAVNNGAGFWQGGSKDLVVSVAPGTYYIGVADYDGSTAEIPFTVTLA